MSTPALGSGHGPAETPEPPLEQSSDLGWILVLGAAIALLLATWGLYGTDATGMWAGYCTTGIVIVAIVADASLHSTLPRGPALALIAVCGLGLIVLGLTEIGSAKAIPISEITAGALFLVGAALQA